MFYDTRMMGSDLSRLLQPLQPPAEGAEGDQGEVAAKWRRRQQWLQQHNLGRVVEPSYSPLQPAAADDARRVGAATAGAAARDVEARRQRLLSSFFVQEQVSPWEGKGRQRQREGREQWLVQGGVRMTSGWSTGWDHTGLISTTPTCESPTHHFPVSKLLPRTLKP